MKNLAATDTLFYPSEEDLKKIHEYIYRIKNGKPVALVLLDFEKMISAYNCDGLVPGCTDLLLISDQVENHSM